jgi:predicted peroxiredoxin
MAKLLVHLTAGPESPIKAALAFLVAGAAVDDGHEVTLFLAGHGVQLLRDAVLDSPAALGGGTLRESYESVAGAGARLYASRMSCTALGVSASDLEEKPVELALPTRLVQLALEADRILTY